MTTPTVRPLPAAPSPSDPPDVFDARAYAFTAALPGFGSDFNAAVAWLAPRMSATAAAADQVSNDAQAVAAAAEIVVPAADQVAEDRDAVELAASAAALDRAQAQIAASQAAAAAEASGPLRFFVDYASAAAAADLDDDQVVEVMVDEMHAGQRSRYRVEGGALVYVAAASGLSTGAPTLEVATATYTLSQAHRQHYLRLVAAAAEIVVPAGMGPHDAWDEWAVRNETARAVSITPGSGVTIDGPRALAPGDYAMVKRVGPDAYSFVVLAAPRVFVVRHAATATTDVEIEADLWPTSADGAELMSTTYTPRDPRRWLRVSVSVPTAASANSMGCAVWLVTDAATPALGVATGPVFPPASVPFVGPITFDALVPPAATHVIALRFGPVGVGYGGEAFVGTWDGVNGGFNAPFTAQLIIEEIEVEHE